MPPHSCATTRMKTFCSPHAHEGIAEETQMAPAPEDPGRAPPSSAMQSTIAQRTRRQGTAMVGRPWYLDTGLRR